MTDTSDRHRLRVLLYDGPECAPIGADERLRTLSALLDAGYKVVYGVEAQAESSPSSIPTVVAGPFDDGSGLEAGLDNGGSLHWVDIRGLDSDAVVAQVEVTREQLGIARPKSWVPWFPVIDYDRCTNCKQCLSFCLFGVFGADADDRIEVQNPDQCKTGCPACSRIRSSAIADTS